MRNQEIPSPNFHFYSCNGTGSIHTLYHTLSCTTNATVSFSLLPYITNELPFQSSLISILLLSIWFELWFSLDIYASTFQIEFFFPYIFLIFLLVVNCLGLDFCHLGGCLQILLYFWHYVLKIIQIIKQSDPSSFAWQLYYGPICIWSY